MAFFYFYKKLGATKLRLPNNPKSNAEGCNSRLYKLLANQTTNIWGGKVTYAQTKAC